MADKYDEQVSSLLNAVYSVIDKTRDEAEREAEKCKSEGNMYGWNFHKGRANGMTEVDLDVRETLRPAVAAALRELGCEVERLTQRWNEQFTRNSELIVEHDSLRAEVKRLKERTL